MVELTNCPQIIIITEFSASSVWKMTEISFSAVGGTPLSKYGMWEWRKNLSERFTGLQSQQILLTSKTVRFLQEITKTKTFYSFGTSSQESSLKPSISMNHQMAIRTVLVLHLHKNLTKNWLGVLCQDQTRWKYSTTKNWSQKFSYRQLLWLWTFISTIKRTSWLSEVWRGRFMWLS